jgi:NAD(P)-dependent dehydrogenase (short-subunit alcohol dehydrogenase family)
MSPVAFITGCSEPEGFGWLTSLELIGRGHTVIGTMRDVDGRNSEAAAELRAEGIDVTELDVTDDAGVDRVVGAALRRHGRVDALVNNAADVRLGALEDTTVESLRTVLDANVLGPHRLIRAVLPGMRARGEGVIVQVSSLSGYSAGPLFGGYSASKHALEAYSEALWYEVGHFGVRVVLVEPGAFMTGLHDRSRWEPGTETGPYAELKRRYWDADLEEWVSGMPDPREVSRVIADAIEDPATPLHVPVGEDAVSWRARARPLSDDELRNQELEGIDW